MILKQSNSDFHLGIDAVIISALLPFSFVLAQYTTIFNINLGMLAVAFLVCIALIRLKLRFTVNNEFIFFLLLIAVSTFATLAMGGTGEGTTYFYIGAIFFSIAILILSSYLDQAIFFKSYRLIGYSAVCVIFVQSIIIYVLGKDVSPITILPVQELERYIWEPTNRPSSFFTEPQFYCSFILPLLLDSLIKKKFIECGVFLVSVLLSGSTFGIAAILALIIWFYMFHNFTIRNLAFGMLLIISIVSLLVYVDIFSNAFAKIVNIDFSTEIRLIKGFIIYEQLEGVEKIFGIRTSVEVYILENIRSFPFLWLYIDTEAERLLGYITTLSGILVNYGIFPFMGFVYFICRTYITTSSAYAKGIILIIVLHSFAATILFNYLFFFYYCQLFHYIKKTEIRLGDN